MAMLLSEFDFLPIYRADLAGSRTLSFHMKHDQIPGPQNYKIGSGRISKMAVVTKNSKKLQNQLFL